MHRKALSLLLSVFMVSGCAVKLPPKVDYTVDENAKPEIEQIQDGKLNQVTFETKIDEIRVKAEKYVVSDSVRSSINIRADNLLSAQRAYFLENENIPNKSAKCASLAGISVGIVGLMAIGMIWGGPEGADAGIKTGMSLLQYSLEGLLAGGLFFGFAGGIVGSVIKDKVIKPEFNSELRHLIADYNEAVGAGK